MYKVMVNCFHQGRLFRFPNEKKSPSRIPWGFPSGQESFVCHVQGFWSRAVRPGAGGVGVGSRGRGSRNHMDGREIEQFVTSQMGTQN